VVDAGHVLEEFGHLASLPLHLGRVIDVLVLATTTLTEQWALGLDPVWGWLKDFYQVTLGAIVVITENARAHLFTR